MKSSPRLTVIDLVVVAIIAAGCGATVAVSALTGTVFRPDDPHAGQLTSLGSLLGSASTAAAVLYIVAKAIQRSRRHA